MVRSKSFDYRNYIDDIKIYIEAQKNISLFSESLGSTHISILQPYLGFKNPKHKKEKEFTHYEFRDKVIKDLYHYTHNELLNLHSKTNSYYLDGRYFYEDNNNRIFTDDVHFYNEDGYKIILDK